MRNILACGCLLLVPIAVSAQSSMSKAEAAQLYTAAGFPIVSDQPVNRCGKPATPRVTFVDINGDKRPEALFVDADATCYAPSGRYFAVLTKEGTIWRSIAGGNGSVQALSTRTAGFPDMRVTDSDCARDHHFDGRTYKPATNCSVQALVAEPQPIQPVPGPPAAKTAVSTLQAADEAAAFKTAGFKWRGGKWRSDCDDPDSSGVIESAEDLNGDGVPDVVITESGTRCYGNTGQRFWLVSKLGSGGWRLMTSSVGIPEFLKTKGADGWPDVLVGGPGFCFPAERWNGKEYKLHRWEYDGKACKR